MLPYKLQYFLNYQDGSRSDVRDFYITAKTHTLASEIARIKLDVMVAMNPSIASVQTINFHNLSEGGNSG